MKLEKQGSGISLPTMRWKIIRSLENRGILLKGTIIKITSQERDFINFSRQLVHH